jgi:hypothetical protein
MKVIKGISIFNQNKPFSGFNNNKKINVKYFRKYLLCRCISKIYLSILYTAWSRIKLFTGYKFADQLCFSIFCIYILTHICISRNCNKFVHPRNHHHNKNMGHSRHHRKFLPDWSFDHYSLNLSFLIFCVSIILYSILLDIMGLRFICVLDISSSLLFIYIILHCIKITNNLFFHLLNDVSSFLSLEVKLLW